MLMIMSAVIKTVHPLEKVGRLDLFLSIQAAPFTASMTGIIKAAIQNGQGRCSYQIFLSGNLVSLVVVWPVCGPSWWTVDSSTLTVNQKTPGIIKAAIQNGQG